MTQSQMEEKAGAKEREFLYEIYNWLCESRNRCVEDFHQDLTGLYTKENLIKNSKDFVKQRICCSDEKYRDINIDEVARMYTAGLYENEGVFDMDDLEDNETLADFFRRKKEAV